MNNSYDIIIIGGGHNGLTAATALARKSKKVLLLEKKSILGGIASGEEFHAGYKTVGLLHDSSTVRNKVIKALELKEFGLTLSDSKPEVTLLAKDGRTVTIYDDVDKTCAEIAKISQKDADGYREHRMFVDKISSFITGLLNNLPPDLVDLKGQQLWGLAKKGWGLKKLGNKTMMEFLKVAPMSVQDYLDEKFETEFIKAGLSGPAIYGSYTSPRSAYTTLNFLIHECTVGNAVVGGPQALIETLERAAKASGVDIQTNATVDKILLDQDRKVTGVKLDDGTEYHTSSVASSCSPHMTFFDFLMPNQIDYSLEREIELYRARGTTAKINLAVNTDIQLNGVSSSFYRTGNSFLDMEKSFDPSKYREFSTEPVLDIHIPSVETPSLSPAGHHVASILIHYAPYKIEGGWTEEAKNQLLANTIKTLEQYAPDIASSIVASEVLSPVDLETRYSLPQGHIFHGEHAVDQVITRPIPACARYATPVQGLYLCGSGAFPGGGITCMPGYLAAEMMMK